IHDLLAAAFQVGVEHRRAHLGAAAAVLVRLGGVLVRGGIRVRGIGAAVEPGDAERAVAGAPKRGEAVLGGGAVVVDEDRRAPVEAGVGGAAERDVGGVAFADALQPVHPQRAVRGGGDVRNV